MYGSITIPLYHYFFIYFSKDEIQRNLFSSQGAEAERFSISDILICHLRRSCIILSFFQGVAFQIKVQNYRMLVFYSVIAVWQLFHLTTRSRSLAASHFDSMKRICMWALTYGIFHILCELWPTLLYLIAIYASTLSPFDAKTISHGIIEDGLEW